ncbi:component of oligomeric golgi complex 6 [Gigaspora rosea]|uniref:Conserved oligomeric Golgi complex subunit 6 n=1 Tax=Gigaspora rosea TaxID=44941 RepID=A0A397V3U6_9GLOM|nr:component of oligomeric golgi complex 6 [Gigaspora rosea]
MVVESISIPPIRRNSSKTPTPTPLSLAEDNPISLKVSKILICPIDDIKTKSALEALSEFYTSNSVTERRNLRGNIEQKAIETNRNFLEIFGKVTEQLATIESEVKNMNNFCDEISKSLDSAKRQTALLLEQSDSLKSQRESCKIRKILIDAFLEKFTLSEKEVATLSSPDAEIGPEFFEVLKHLQQIHSDCDALLITENQRAGLEIMERMNSYQETAFDKLYRWTQAESRSLGRDTQEVPVTLKLALKTLKQRPVLFKSCLEELVYIRKNSIIRAFMDALTRGGPGGTPRPIELHAHDPLRYVGDMLAWIHQTVANEREFLESLFEIKNESDHSNIENLDKENDDIVVRDLLDRDIDGTCRPLKIRVEQVLGSQPGAITGYRILNLIQFYKITIARILGPNATLSIILKDITDSASRVFFNTLNMQAEQLLRYRQTPGADLMPPPVVKETVLQLKEIMASYETSLVTATEREDDFRTILDTILDPLFQMCELGANDLSKFDKAIYMINCLHYVQSSLTPYSFTHGRVMLIERQIEENLEILVDGQYANLLNQSGLGPIVQIMETKDENTPLSLYPNMDTNSLTNTMARLDSFLSLADTDTFKLQGHPQPLVKKVNRRVMKMFVEAYRRISDAIKDPKNRYGFPATILARTVDEVENLLMID